MPFENISIAEYKQEESKHLKNIWKKKKKYNSIIVQWTS